MLSWRGFVTATLVALQVVSADQSPGQSTFVSPSNDLAFALTVPDNASSDIYFSLRSHRFNSWAAVGLGSHDMKGALYLFIYPSLRGNNITFSPRLAYDNYEPFYFDKVGWEVLPGSGIDGEYIVFNARCFEHCRSWPAGSSDSGYIDVSSPSQRAIYALGPKEIFHSDNPAANLKYHREYGVFTIDMKRTQGVPDAPVLNSSSRSDGTFLDSSTHAGKDVLNMVHSVFMLFFMVVMFIGYTLARLNISCQSALSARMLSWSPGHRSCLPPLLTCH
ncbi:hypothetical protein CDD82_3440 [Ophiocordyceps australis]|uniref:Cellobiose dehydrogenase-like cytochrome domain-containing protein n=1 Tax=Ophiocordyceps australis TaxID=1399860 RepID=A0A2C5ZPY4_9HYPO|nr:hypothetical protein CDD82_3440 [Ophiocordyceps australis]